MGIIMKTIKYKKDEWCVNYVDSELVGIEVLRNGNTHRYGCADFNDGRYDFDKYFRSDIDEVSEDNFKEWAEKLEREGELIRIEKS